jgi:hypothetical protein
VTVRPPGAVLARTADSAASAVRTPPVNRAPRASSSPKRIGAAAPAQAQVGSLPLPRGSTTAALREWERRPSPYASLGESGRGCRSDETVTLAVQPAPDARAEPPQAFTFPDPSTQTRKPHVLRKTPAAWRVKQEPSGSLPVPVGNRGACACAWKQTLRSELVVSGEAFENPTRTRWLANAEADHGGHDTTAESGAHEPGAGAAAAKE